MFIIVFVKLCLNTSPTKRDQHQPNNCQVLQQQAAELSLKKLNGLLVSKFGGNMQPWTDYYVCNTYSHADQRAGSHADAHELWGALAGESVILSYTYEQGCIFVTDVASDRGHRSNECLWTALKNDGLIVGGKYAAPVADQVLTEGLVEAIYCPPNSLLVM